MPPEEMIQDAYKISLNKPEFDQFKRIWETTQIRPRFPDHIVQKQYQALLRFGFLRDFIMFREVTGVAPSNELYPVLMRYIRSSKL